MVDHLEMRRALNRAEQALTAPDSGGWSKVNEVWTETTDDLYLDEIDLVSDLRDQVLNQLLSS